jgi:peptide/nickel transport system permease protein
MLVVGFIAFSLFNFVGDPVSLMLPPEATQADREQMRQQLGLDQPFYRSSCTFLGNAVQGNFGISLGSGARSPRCWWSACPPRSSSPSPRR